MGKEMECAVSSVKFRVWGCKGLEDRNTRYVGYDFWRAFIQEA